MVVFTNQGAVVADVKKKSYVNLTTKINSMIDGLGVDEVVVLAAPKLVSAGGGGKRGVGVRGSEQGEMYGEMRKPGVGMWKYLETVVLEMGGSGGGGSGNGWVVDYENSVFVGDAAGRPGDFLDSDAMFAKNVGIEFKTPEEVFK